MTFTCSCLFGCLYILLLDPITGETLTSETLSRYTQWNSLHHLKITLPVINIIFTVYRRNFCLALCPPSKQYYYLILPLNCLKHANLLLYSWRIVALNAGSFPITFSQDNAHRSWTWQTSIQLKERSESRIIMREKYTKNNASKYKKYFLFVVVSTKFIL